MSKTTIFQVAFLFVALAALWLAVGAPLSGY
jgi:hypothetical protein